MPTNHRPPGSYILMLQTKKYIDLGNWFTILQYKNIKFWLTGGESQALNPLRVVNVTCESLIPPWRYLAYLWRERKWLIENMSKNKPNLKKRQNVLKFYSLLIN